MSAPTADPTDDATTGRVRWAALRPLRHRNFALIWSAALISNVGTWMETVAVGDLVTKDTGQAGWTALVAAAGFLPMGLMGPIGGAIADRVDRRRFVIGTVAAQAACAVALTLLAATDNAAPGAVAAVIFVAGCVGGIGFPAYQSMLPELVPREDLLGAVSLGQAQWNLGRVIGPALAGIVIAVGDYAWAFGVNAVSFAAVLLAFGALRLPPREVFEDDPDRDAGVWRRIRGGVAAAREDSGIKSAIAAISIVALTVSPFIALLPAMARVHHDGGEGLTSAFVTAQGVGAVAGALLVPTIAERMGRNALLMRALVALPASLVLYAVAPGPVWATLALVLVGATYIAVFSGIGTVVQLRAPDRARARVLSLYFLALGVLYPVGSTIQGPLADHVGIPEVTIGGALVLLAVVAAVRSLRPSWLRALVAAEPEGTPA